MRRAVRGEQRLDAVLIGAARFGRMRLLVPLLAAAVLSCTPVAEPPSDPAPTEAATDAAADSDLDVTEHEVGDAGHVEGAVDYEQSPPVGGEHAGEWQNCGFYAGEVTNENAVHSLEHGAVWITYAPGTDTTGLAPLADDYVLISQYPDQDASVVATAWGLQLELDGPDDPRLQTFIDTYAEGPQTPEPGAPCSGGLGEPSQGA